MINKYFTLQYSIPALLLSIYVLYPYNLFQYFYLLILNGIINTLLKHLIREKRPLDNLDTLGKQILNFDKYGMPSGHTQSTGFNTLYTYLVSRNKYVLVIQSILTFLTFKQRIDDKFHTFKQTLYGLIIGIMIAFISYYYLNNK